jgi:hypothetical protein
MHQKNAVPVMTALFLSLLGAGPAASAATPKPAELDWLKTNAVLLKTCEGGRGFDDLAPLKSIIGSARIVSLGECTHGTREVFQMKHRLLEYLAHECGFTPFAIEANMPEAYRLNDYVLEGKGDPTNLIGGMYLWTWNTEEVLAMVQWMRQYNQSGQGRLEFTGFDMQTPEVAMGNVLRFVKENDPTRRQSVEEVYRQIKNSRLRRGRGPGSQFGVEKPMGACLDEWYGKEQVVIGFAAGEGQYTAVSDKQWQHKSPWAGRDWVWPRAAADARLRRRNISALHWILLARSPELELSAALSLAFQNRVNGYRQIKGSWVNAVELYRGSRQDRFRPLYMTDDPGRHSEPSKLSIIGEELCLGDQAVRAYHHGTNAASEKASFNIKEIRGSLARPGGIL